MPKLPLEELMKLLVGKTIHDVQTSSDYDCSLIIVFTDNTELFYCYDGGTGFTEYHDGQIKHDVKFYI